MHRALGPSLPCLPPECTAKQQCGPHDEDHPRVSSFSSQVLPTPGQIGNIHHSRSKATAIVATPIAAPSIAALNPCRTLSLIFAFAVHPSLAKKRDCSLF